VDGDASFTSLLDKVREDALSTYAYQALPFEKIVEELKIPRSPDRNPLFQVMFNMDQESTESLLIAGLKIEGVPLDFLQSRFDLHMGARPGNGLELICTYNPDLFKPSTIRAMLESLTKLADLVLAMPQAAISTLLARLQQIEQEEISSNKRELARKQGLGIESIRRRTSTQNRN
jgi:non-ribosomal peptide synthetase component F